MVRSATFISAMIALLAVTAAVWLHATWLLPNHDNEWYLVAAERMMAGGVYLTDFLEPNPPLIIMLNVPPVAFARLAGLDVYSCFSAYVGLMILSSVALIWQPVVACLGGDRVRAAGVVAALAVVLALMPGYEYGQREHLMVVLFLPFVLWSAARAAGAGGRLDGAGVAILVLGTLAALIKPYFLLLPIALLVLRLLGPERLQVLRDPAVPVFVAITALYAIAILALFPSYLAMAELQGHVYHAWNRSWATVLANLQAPVTVMGLLLVLGMVVPLAAPMRSALLHLGMAALGALASALIQRKGWDYHVLPIAQFAVCGLVLFAARLAAQLRNAEQWRSFGLLALIVPLAGLQFLSAYTAFAAVPRSRYAALPLLAALRERAPGRPVMLLTGGYIMGYPSMAGVTIGASAPGQGLLPGTVLLERGGPAERARAVAIRPIVTKEVADDLERFRPVVVAVDRRRDRQALPDDLDILDWYLSDPRVAALWTSYRADGGVVGWDFYRLAADGALEGGPRRSTGHQ